MAAIFSMLVVAALLTSALALIAATLREGAPAIARALVGGMTPAQAAVTRRREVRTLSRRPATRARPLRAAA